MVVHTPGTSSKTLFAVLLSRRSQTRGLARERLRTVKKSLHHAAPLTASHRSLKKEPVIQLAALIWIKSTRAHRIEALSVNKSLRHGNNAPGFVCRGHVDTWMLNFHGVWHGAQVSKYH